MTGTPNVSSDVKERVGVNSVLQPRVEHPNVTNRSLCRCPVFEEPEDPGSRSFFSEIISSVSDVKFSHSGRYLLTRDYLTAKVWDLNMDKGPVETYQVRRHRAH